MTFCTRCGVESKDLFCADCRDPDSDPWMRGLARATRGNHRNTLDIKGKRQALIEQELKLGTPTPEICRKFGISDRTVYRWKSKILR